MGGEGKKLIWHIWFGAQTLTERMSRCFSVRCDLNCSRFKLEPLEQKMIILGGGGHKSVVIRQTFAPLMCASDRWVMCLPLCLIQFSVCVCVFSFSWRLASRCVFDSSFKCNCSRSDGPRPRRWAVSQLSVWKWWWKVDEETGQDAFP